MVEVPTSIIIKLTSLIFMLRFVFIPKLDALVDAVLCLSCLVVGISYNSESRKSLAVMSQYQYPFFKSYVIVRVHFGSAVIPVCNKPTCYH